MDDHLVPRPEETNEELSEGDEDVPDWTRLASSISATRPTLPKRGDKEFEPAANGPTNLQTHSLNRARDAMFGALDAERGISSKSVSYAIWYPRLARARVTQARGVHFHGMGHSVGRTALGTGHPQKHTELLPEETLYMIERGSLFCWKDEPAANLTIPSDASDLDASREHSMQGSPMSVQHAFTAMIGSDDLTLERYHAFAYLKRLGFNVLRAKPPSPSYPTPPPVVTRQSLQASFLARLFRPIITIFSLLKIRISGGINWWKPLSFGIWFGARNYASLYRSLRFIPSGHNALLHVMPSILKPEDPHGNIREDIPSPYEIFYNVYKPNTPFKKSAPPPPDFSLVVVNARTTALPSIYELTYLWSSLPETGPPPPRQRHRTQLPKNSSTTTARHPPASATPPSSLLSWLLGHKNPKSEKNTQSPRPPHPFAILKAGKKTVVVGAVDSGTVGFFRFGMGAFEEMPLL